MKSKILIRLFLGLMMSFSLSGCLDNNTEKEKNRDAFKQYISSSNESKDNTAEKIHLTCLSGEANWELDRDIEEFNSSQTNYIIDKVVYNGDEDYDIWLDKQMALGNYPDIYDVTIGVGSMSIEQCVDKGLFENLDGYIENDDSISKEDFIPSIYNSMCVNNELYFCAASVSISSLAIKDSKIDSNISGWTLEEFETYINDKERENIWLINTNNKTANLNLLLSGCGDDFIDWDNASCAFDSPEFITLLEICNRNMGSEMNYKDNYMDSIEMISEGKQLFQYEECLNPEVMLWDEALFKGDIKYIGFPNSKGKGSFLRFYNALAISKFSNNKEGAWEFVKWRMTEDYQGTRYMSIDGSPTRKDVFDEYLKYELSTEEYIDSYGNEILPNKGAIIRNDLYVRHEGIPLEILEEYKNLIYNSSDICFNDYRIIQIIDDEVDDYFNGDKNVEETAKLIQDRVQLYLSEGK